MQVIKVGFQFCASEELITGSHSTTTRNSINLFLPFLKQSFYIRLKDSGSSTLREGIESTQWTLIATLFRITCTTLTAKLGCSDGWEGHSNMRRRRRIYYALWRDSSERIEKRENREECLGSASFLHTWRNRWLNTRSCEKHAAAILSTCCR